MYSLSHEIKTIDLIKIHYLHLQLLELLDLNLLLLEDINNFGNSWYKGCPNTIVGPLA